MRANKLELETAAHGCIFDYRFGLYHVDVVLSFLRSNSLTNFTYILLT